MNPFPSEPSRVRQGLGGSVKYHYVITMKYAIVYLHNVLKISKNVRSLGISGRGIRLFECDAQVLRAITQV